MMASVPNFRDLGGLEAADGRRVRRGLVYRSEQLYAVSPEDLAWLAGLGLAGVFDLRSPEEAQARPDRLPPGVSVVAIDVLADAQLGGLDGFERLLRDPREANAILGGGKVDATLERVYRGFVSLPSARRGFGRLFSAILEPGGLPLLFHCATGKDRTGWAAAALLTLLGVPRAAVEADYLASNAIILAGYRPVIDRFAAAGGERRILESLFGVHPAHLAAAFDEMTQHHGSMASYFAEGLGIGPAAQDALRTLLLDPS